MTNQELENFLQTVWRDPENPPETIPPELVRYAYCRARQAKSDEFVRLLRTFRRYLFGEVNKVAVLPRAMPDRRAAGQCC